MGKFAISKKKIIAKFILDESEKIVGISSDSSTLCLTTKLGPHSISSNHLNPKGWSVCL